MKKWIMIFLIGGLADTVFTCFLVGASTRAYMEDKEVLVLDFIGFGAAGKDHARTFQETVLPDANVVSIGIHGRIVSDQQRQGAGYDTIIRAGSTGDYERSVGEVYGLIKQDQTIIGFDVNEHGLPQQLRGDSLSPVLRLLPNKIYHPAMVAARVAERWLQEHPNGKLTLRGHSDGTYAVGYIFDYLKKKGIAPTKVILESPRQVSKYWTPRAKATQETTFVSITSDNDLPRESIIGRGHANVLFDNWINFHVQGLRDPLSAHGIVTDYRNPGLKIQRTDAKGRTFTENVPLGTLIAKALSSLPSRSKAGSLNPSVVHSDLPALDEKKKGVPIDPWDKGGGTLPSTPSQPRGGLVAPSPTDIQQGF